MLKLANTLTNKEYVKNVGGYCPVCESTDIEAPSSPEIDGGTAWQDVKCGVCGSRWADYYKLVEYGMDEPKYDWMDDVETIKTFDSGVSIVKTPGGKAVYVEAKEKFMWFTTLDSPRIKRIKDKKVREDVVQALHEIKLIKKLE